MNHPPSSKLAFATLIAGAILISYSGVFVKLSEIGPQATGFYRMFLPLPALGLWLIVRRRRNEGKSPSMTHQQWRAVALAGFFLAVDLMAWHWSLKRIPVGAATLLGNTAPFWVALSGYFLFGERFTFRFMIGMLVAFIGAGALVAGGGGSVFGGDGIGYLLGLVAGMGYGGYLRFISEARSGLDNGQVLFYSALFCAICLLPVMLFLEDIYWPVTLSGWLVLFGLAYMSQLMGQGLIALAMGHLPAAFSAVSLLINPVAAALFAWLTLGETLSTIQIAGGIFVLTGIMMARR